jgi:hypothetical protein
MENKRNLGKLDGKWRLELNLTITIVMQVICSYRVHEDLQEIKKVTFYLLAVAAMKTAVFRRMYDATKNVGKWLRHFAESHARK